MKWRIAFGAIALVQLVLCAQSDARDETERIAVPLSDAGRPATLDVDLTAGIIEVVGSSRRDVSIEATPGAQVSGAPRPVPRPRERPDTSGLRRISPPMAVEIDESNNVVTVRGREGQRVDLTIEVPVRTNFKLRKTAQGSTLGTVTVRGLDGDLEIHTEGGKVMLIDVSGSVVAHSTNSSVVATVRRVTADRPMAFTSYSGNIDVTLPKATKADVIMRADRGEVYTDFDVDLTNKRQPLRGRINGGGPEFELRTYGGSVYLRKGN